jgi:hypothetical protein
MPELPQLLANPERPVAIARCVTDEDIGHVCPVTPLDLAGHSPTLHHP